MTGVEDAISLPEKAIALNNLMNGYIFAMVLGAMFLILLFVFSAREIGRKDNFVLSSFITSIIGGFFWGAGLIGYNILIYPVILFLASLLIRIMTGPD